MLDPSPEDDGTSPTVSTPRFVGRDRELAALRGALARPPAIVLVEEGDVPAVTKAVEDAFAAAGYKTPRVFEAVPSPGARRLF